MKKSQKWTPEDDRNTFRQGYGIFERSDNGKLEIHGLDDPEGVAADFDIEVLVKFEGGNRDFLAADHVKKLAAEGDATARKAIETLIAFKSPDVRLFKLAKTW